MVAPAHARMTEAERDAYRTLRALCDQQDTEAKDTWEKLSRKERRLIQRRLIYEFESYPEPIPGVGEPWACLARLAGLFKIREATPYVLQWVEDNPKAHVGQILWDTGTESIGRGISPITERHLIQFITHPSNSLEKKHQAQIALVNLDTRRSTRAWLDLRDAARAHSEAPKPKREYTHREKIYEAFLMYYKYIPQFFGKGVQIDQIPSSITNFAVTVSEDYCTAELRVNHSSYATSAFSLCRHGDEWIISHYSGTVMP